MNKNPTIRSLAKLAGVSDATVSLALRNHPRISQTMRERIQQIALKAGYKPNPLVANLCAQLRLSKTVVFKSTLGLLFVEEIPNLPTFNEWISGCRERALSLGYGIDSFSLAQSEITPQRLVQILNARNITGLIVIGHFKNNRFPPELDLLWERSFAIVIGLRPIRPALNFVSNDQFSTVETAIGEILNLGYKRPGLCIHPHVDNWVENRFTGGFYASQAKLPAKDRIPVCPFDIDSIGNFHAWVERYRPDVILSVHLEIESWLNMSGLNVPGDIGLVHLDYSSNMRWAGMYQNNHHIGCAAVDVVVGQIHRNEYGVPPFQKSVFITSKWIAGATVRKQNPEVLKPRKKVPVVPPGKRVNN